MYDDFTSFMKEFKSLISDESNESVGGSKMNLIESANKYMYEDDYRGQHRAD